VWSCSTKRTPERSSASSSRRRLPAKRWPRAVRVHARRLSRQLSDAHLFQQSGLGEEAAPARRAEAGFRPAQTATARSCRWFSSGPCPAAREAPPPSEEPSTRSRKAHQQPHGPACRQALGRLPTGDGSSPAARSRRLAGWKASPTRRMRPLRRCGARPAAYDEVFANQLALSWSRASNRRAGAPPARRWPPPRQAELPIPTGAGRRSGR
jgi:hypothetical protein